MTTFRSRIVPLSILTIAFSPLFARQAAAEAPAVVERVFAVYLGESKPAPDFQGATSLNIIVHPLHTEPTKIERFLDDQNYPWCQDDHNCRSSGWAMVGGSGTHVSIGGAETIVFHWIYNSDITPLADAFPPSGSRARSGEGGDVEDLGTYVVSEETDGWKIIGPEDDNQLGGERMCFARGWFTK